MTDMPPEPLTPSEAGFAMIREVFVSLRRAEFSTEEAAAVVAAMLKASQ